MRVVDGLAPLPHGGGNRCAYAPSQNANEIGQARCVGNVLRRNARQGDLGQGQEEHRHAHALPKLRPENVPKIHVGIEIGAPPKTRGIGEKTHGHQYAHVHAPTKLTNDGRQNHWQDADGRGSQARPSGGIAQLGLHHQRQEHNRAHVHQESQAQRYHAHSEIAVFEQLQIDNRVFRTQFPHNQIRQAHHRNHTQHDDFGRGKPIQLFASIKHHLQRAHAQNQ